MTLKHLTLQEQVQETTLLLPFTAVQNPVFGMGKYCLALLVLLSVVLEDALAQKVVPLPPLALGSYCGCSKGTGRCIRSVPAQARTCRYIDCTIYTCDAVQTISPDAICIVRSAETQLVATPTVSSETKLDFPCNKIAKTHTFLQFYSTVVAGNVVDFAEAARNDFIVQSAGGSEETDSTVKQFISNVALLAKDPSRVDSNVLLSRQAQHLANTLGGNQDNPASIAD